MMVTHLGQLPAIAARAIIINCRTRAVTTLALMSALRHANMPVLLIDCESTDGSWPWFAALAEKHGFDMLRLPLQPHGKTLDGIFRASRDDALLLVDSDLEILREDVVPAMRQALQAPNVYGAGFLHQGGDMSVHADIKANVGRYMDRMWIPLCLLKVAASRLAIEKGGTFMHSRDYLEFPWHMGLAKLLYARHRLPWLKNISLEAFADSRERIHGERFLFREYDTGARLHQAMVKVGLDFTDLGEPYLSQSLRHYHGVTRATLIADQQNATTPGAIADEVAARLLAEYAIALG